MVESTPSEMIIAFLTEPPKKPAAPMVGVDLGGGWMGRSGGEPVRARPGTVRVVKSRRLPASQLHAVTFVDEDGAPNRSTFHFVQDGTGRWRTTSVGGGTGPELTGVAPHASLSAGWGPEGFHAGGVVVGNGLGAVFVRLVATDRPPLEDVIEDGRVLFVTEATMPSSVTVEVLDSTGKVIGRHPLTPTS